MFSYLSPESRVPADHPLRPIRAYAEEALDRMSPVFSQTSLIAVIGEWLPRHRRPCSVVAVRSGTATGNGRCPNVPIRVVQ